MVGLIVGFAVGLLARRHLEFKNEVLVGDVLNLFSAVLIALVLQNAIQKRVGNTRVEKDLLIARITAMDESLNQVHKLFMQRAQDAASVSDAGMFGAFGDLSNHLWLLEEAFARSKTRMTTIDVESLVTARRDYRKFVLGDDFSRGPYSQATINREQHAFRKFKASIITVTFEVNYR